MRARFTPIALAAAIAAACTETAAPPSARPAASLSDGAHSDGNVHFFFLPPMVANPHPTGTPDGSLSPVVDICEWDGTTCVASLARFTTDLATTTTTQPGNSETVRPSGSHYLVNWHTDNFDLNTAHTYRISVSVGGQCLGHADVDVVGSGKDLKKVDTQEFVGLVDGRTLPIDFTIEQGALAEPADPACGGAAAVISGTVTNNDGTGDTPAVGWGVYLLDSGGNLLQSTTTGAGGTYSFGPLPAGTYLVCEDAPGDLLAEVVPGSGASCPAPYALLGYTITLGGSSTGNNFLNAIAS
jgi:hypothetical protein